MNHHPAVRKYKTLTLCAVAENHRTHGSSHTNACGADVTRYVVHGVYETETCHNPTSGTVKVHIDVTCLQRIEVKKLGYGSIARLVVNLSREIDDPVQKHS